MTTNDKFFMDGTEMTGQYVVLLVTELGRVGFRDLGDGRFRVRVEPFGNPPAQALTEELTRSRGWKQPGDNQQHRFSSEALGQNELESSIDEALRGLLASATTCEVNPDAPEWARDLVEVIRKQMTGESLADLLAEARALGIRGANSRWKPETLRRKIAEARVAQS